ncbi:hypothetical protein CHUAL_012849 [Chamberlinius hualienensis]
MSLNGCGKCVKVTMSVANLLILVGGIAVLAIGIWTCVDKGYMEQLLGNDLYMSSAYILIAMGSMIIVISFIGGLGAIREIKCLLLSYFIILFLIFVILLIGGILGYVFKDKVKSSAKSTMISSITLDSWESDTELQRSWDTLQTTLKCCGVATTGKLPYEAWEKNSYFGGPNQPKVPDSCCIRNADGSYKNVADCRQSPSNNTVYDHDCYLAAVDFIQGHALILGGVGVGISCQMIIGMVFACVLFKLIE